MIAELIAFLVGTVFGAGLLELCWYERRRRKCKLEEVPFSSTAKDLQACPDCEMPILPGMDCPTCYLRNRTNEDGD